MMAGFSPVQDSSAQLLHHSACFGTGRHSGTVADSRNFDSEALSIWGEHSGRAASSPTPTTSWNGCYSVSFSVANKGKSSTSVVPAAPLGYICHENGALPFPQAIRDISPVNVARCRSLEDVSLSADCPSDAMEGQALQDAKPCSAREAPGGNKMEEAEAIEARDVDGDSKEETCGQCSTRFPSMKTYLSHDCTGGTNSVVEDYDDELSNGEMFEGRIVYNPDGSAYIIEGELEPDDAESLVNVPKQEGAIVEHKDKVIASSDFLSYPQIASAVYIRCPPPSSGSGSFFVNPSNVWPRSEVPVMHSYRVYDFRSGKQPVLEKKQDFALRGSIISGAGNMNLIPTKPILMCFICKLSFGYVKSFVTHASVEHNMSLNNDERVAIFSTNASALIQNVGQEKIPHMSFLEPVMSLPPETSCRGLSPTHSAAQVLSPQQTPSTVTWKLSGVDAGYVIAEPPGPSSDAREEDSLEQQGFHHNQRPVSEPAESKSGCVEGISECTTSRAHLDRPAQTTSASHEQVETHGGDVTSTAATHFSSLWTQRMAGLPDEKNNNSISNSTSEPQATSFSLSSTMFRSFDFGKLYSSSSIVEPHAASSAAAVTSQTLHLNTSSHMLSTSQTSCPISAAGSSALAVGFPTVGRSDTDHLLGMGTECESFYPVCDRSPAGQIMASLHSRNSCKTLKCPKCNWHYKYQETLEIHMKEKHPEAETQCVYCNSGQPHPRLARGESYTCGYKPYRCDICNYSTTTKGNLSIHLQSDKHSNNMQELQNGGSGSGAGPTSEAKLPPATPSSTTVVNASPSVSSAAGGPAARKNKQKAVWRCDFCSYETTEARNLRIHMTSEKHAHNLMALQQNMRQMQMNHQMALFGQDPSLLGLPQIMGLQPPPPPPSAFDPSIFMPPFLTGLPETPMDLTKPNLAEAIEHDSSLSKPDCRSGMFVCAICNAFSTDSIDLLQHHIQLDRSKSADSDSVTVVGGTYLCNLCQYKTMLKANFQLHCKTDKHLQRLQLVNHIQEGSTSNELSQKFLSSAGSPVQVWCSACDYHTNSIYRLQMHVVGSSHEVNARLFAHLQSTESRFPVSVRRSYRCALCGFAGTTRFSLIEHAQSESHAIKERLSLTHGDSGQLEKALENFCVVVEEEDSMAESDADDSVASCGEAEARHRASSYDALDDSLDDMKRSKGDGPSCGSSSTSLGLATASETGTVTLRNQLEQRAGPDDYRSGTVACILCMEPIDSRDQLQHHLIEVHKVKAETLQSIMKLADAADQMTLPSISAAPSPPCDGQKPHPGTDSTQNTPEESFQTLQLFEAGNEGLRSPCETVLPASVCGGVASPSTFHWRQAEVDAGKNEDRSLSVVESKVRIGEEVHSTLDAVHVDDGANTLEPDDQCRCQTCLRRFPTIDALYSHQNELGHLELKQTQSGPGYLCWHKGCSQYFKTANAVQVHHREVHVLRPIQATALSVATEEHSNYQHRCGQCSLAFKTVDQLQVHSYYHVIRSAADCVVCGKSFQSASEAKTHLEKCHMEALTQEQMAKYQAHAAVASSLALLGASCLDGLSNSLPMTSEITKSETRRPVTSQTELIASRSDESHVRYCHERSTLKSEEHMDCCGHDDTPKLDENSNANLSDTGDEGTGGNARLLQQGFEDYVAGRSSDFDGNHSALKYKCHRCKVGFPKMSYLSAHNKTLQHRQGSKLSHPLEKYFDPNRPYKCEVCMESFTQKNILLVHYNSVSHLHRLKQQQQQVHHTTTQHTSEHGEFLMEPFRPGSNETENIVTEEMEIDAEDAESRLETASEPLPPASSHFSVITSVGKAIPVTSTEAKTTGDSNAAAAAAAKTKSSSVFDMTAMSVGATTTADEQPVYHRCERCLIRFDSQSGLDAHPCSNFHKSQSERWAEMSNPHQMKQTLTWMVPNKSAFMESGVKFPATAAQWPVMQSSTSLMSTSVALTAASVLNNVFPTTATVSLASSDGHQLSQLTTQSLMNGAQGRVSVSTGQGPPAADHPQRGQNICTCQSCGAGFVSLEFLTQHQQHTCGGADSTGTMSYARPSTVVRQEAGLSLCKPRIHHTLLQNFGFDCVMQFNECCQKTGRAPAPSKDSSNDIISFPETENNKVGEKPGEKMNGESVEKQSDDDLPELRRCICCLCLKEFSSVWVLKAHEEEVHRELLPSNLIQEFGKQFRKFYESRHLTLESRRMADAVTKQPPVSMNRRQDFVPIEHHASKLESESQTPRTSMSGFSSAEMAAQMMQLPLMMGLNLLPPPMMPMMMPLGAELFGLPPFSLMDPSMLMLPQANQKSGAVAVSSQSSVAVPQKSARTRITDDQLSVLRAHFDINNSPSEDQIRDMSERTGLLPKVIKHWFRNTLFKERQRNKDSPYNFSNPPSTTLNLEEYEKLTQSVIKKERPTENRDEPERTEAESSGRQIMTPRSEGCMPSGQSSHLDSKEGENWSLTPLKGASSSAALSSMDTVPRLTFPPPLLNSGGDLSAAVISNLMHMPPIFLPSQVLPGSNSATPKVPGMVYSGGGAGSQMPGMVYSGGNASSQERRANRTRFTKHQIRVLQEFFEQNAYPKDEELENLSKLLDLSPRVIVVWFQNARQKVRKNFENQAPVDMSEEGTSMTGAVAQIPFPTGSTYQCKKCIMTFPRYDELVKHKQNVCFKDDENCYVSVSNSAISGEISDDEEDRGDGASRSSMESESKGFGGAGAGAGLGIEYCCEKCNLVFYHLEKWKEHQSIHAASLGLAVPQSSLASLAAKSRNNYERDRDRIEGFGGIVQEDGSQGRHWSDDGDDRDDQPRDKRIRTTILPEQLDYLYHKYQSDCNPSRKQLDAIAARVGLKKRVVQVWFQNTRARERKGQYRAHQQLIHKRCPFCKALFRAKTALEAHLTSKHPEETSRREINIDNIPDEPTEASPQLDSPMLASSIGSAVQNTFAKGSPVTSTPYSMSSSFLSGMQNMRGLGSSELLHSNMQRLYEDSFKKYIDELSHASHQTKPEPPAMVGFRPDLMSSAVARIKQEDSPLDLSMSMKTSGAEEQRVFEDNPASAAVLRPYLREDSHSESHSEDNNDDWSGMGAESGPPSPSSSASNQSKATQGGGMAGKRYRTQMSSLQIKVMKSVFADYKTPTMAECEALGREIGLPKRVVQVWFQNARAKEKKWNLSGPEGTATGASSSTTIASPLAATSNNYCSLCDVTYSLQLTVQDHLFTRKHIDNVKTNLHCQKEAAKRSSAAAAAAAAGRESGGLGKTTDGDARTSTSRGEPVPSTSTSHQDLIASISLHSTPVNYGAGFPSQGSDKRQRNGGHSTGHRVKHEKKEILKSPNTDATPSSSLGLLPNQMSTSGAVVPAMTSAVNPGHMMTPFGGFPVLPAVPNPADMMSMMPYLFPCLTGFYPGAGMPFMPTSMVPGLESMFLYDPINFGTPLNMLQIPPTCIKKIQEKLQDKDCIVTHYAQDCHSFADLRRCVAPEDWLMARRATVDVGYICKKCHIVYPGHAACTAHQQMSCFSGTQRPDGTILKLEQLQYECSACLIRCSTVSEFKTHCSQDQHRRHLAVAALKGSSGLGPSPQQKFIPTTMSGNTTAQVESAVDPSRGEVTNGSSVAGASNSEQEN